MSGALYTSKQIVRRALGGEAIPRRAPWPCITVRVWARRWTYPVITNRWPARPSGSFVRSPMLRGFRRRIPRLKAAGRECSKRWAAWSQPSAMKSSWRPASISTRFRGHRVSVSFAVALTRDMSTIYGRLPGGFLEGHLEFRMPAKTSSPTLPLPRSWTSRVKPAILQVISLAQFTMAHTRGWAANKHGTLRASPRPTDAPTADRSPSHAAGRQTASGRSLPARDSAWGCAGPAKRA